LLLSLFQTGLHFVTGQFSESVGGNPTGCVSASFLDCDSSIHCRVIHQSASLADAPQSPVNRLLYEIAVIVGLALNYEKEIHEAFVRSTFVVNRQPCHDGKAASLYELLISFAPVYRFIVSEGRLAKQSKTSGIRHVPRVEVQSQPHVIKRSARAKSKTSYLPKNAAIANCPHTSESTVNETLCDAVNHIGLVENVHAEVSEIVESERLSSGYAILQVS
jgi:hypothetical protein